MTSDSGVTEGQAQIAMENQRVLMGALADAYEDQLNTEMGQLHNQFVVFISTARLPLPQVLLVLQILVQETVEQATRKYLGD